MEKLTNNLFLLIANLSQRKDKQAIIRLFIKGLNSFIPHIFFSWKPEASQSALLEVSTQKKIYGEIVFSEGALKNDPIMLAGLQNAAQMLAVILERLEQEQILNDENKHLESVVQERTSQLQDQVEEFETLYEEYKSLSDQLQDSINRIETNEEQLRSILENSTNIFFRHDINHRLTYLSPQVKAILGYTPEEAKINWLDLTTDNEINKQGYELTKKAIETGVPQPPYELELKSKSGKKVYVEVREAPVVIDKKTTAVVGVLVDITERKKAQEKLLQNRFYLKKAQEMGKIGTWELDIKNDNYYWTEENYKIFEIKKGAGLNLESMLSRLHPDDLFFVQEKWKTGLANGTFEADFRLLLNNKIKWVKQKADIEFNSKGEAVKAVGFTQDITEQKNAEAKLHEKEERYRLLYQNAGIGVGFYNPSGKVIEFNEIALNHTEKTKEEVTGKNLHDLFPKQEADVYLKRIKNTISKNKHQQFEDEIKLHNKKRWYLSSYSCVKDINGKITGVQIMSIEITKLKKAENRLRKSEEKFKSYIKNAPDGVFIINSKGEFREMNAEACTMTGYRSEELLKMNLLQLTPLEAHGKTQQELERLSENDIIRTELPYITSSGDKRYWSIDIANLSEDNYIAFNKDVTEKIEHEKKISEQNEELEKSLNQLQKTTKELQVAKEKAEESDRLKTAFLANMSHEIRTPMNGILGFIDLLQSAEVPDRERGEYLKMMEKSGERLLNTINDIMEISKIEAGQVLMHETRVSVNEILNYLYNFFSPEANSKGLKFYLSNELEKDFCIQTDRTKFESVLFNLIKNAIKFTSKGEVRFGVYRKENTLNFYVSDTGAGIPQNRINAVFDRFVQADLKISRAYEGSGLGLSIAKAYSKLLGGRIHVESEVGKGSTFYFVIDQTSSE